jgi:hypothetical protein
MSLCRCALQLASVKSGTRALSSTMPGTRRRMRSILSSLRMATSNAPTSQAIRMWSGVEVAVLREERTTAQTAVEDQALVAAGQRRKVNFAERLKARL